MTTEGTIWFNQLRLVVDGALNLAECTVCGALVMPRSPAQELHAASHRQPGEMPACGEWVEYGKAPSWMVDGCAQDPHDGYWFERDGIEGGLDSTGTVWAMIDEVSWVDDPSPP